MTHHRTRLPMLRQRGASLVEATVVLPLLLFITLAIMQAASVFYAKSNLNYAALEAARAGSVNNASAASIQLAFQKAMLPYYGGGRTAGELAATLAKVAADATSTVVRVEILSPTQESFSDYNSPRLQDVLKTAEPVIPNVGLDELTCPRDVPGCKSDPKGNASGQTLLDANLLKLRITYGIPERKQMPIVGTFYTWALGKMGSAGTDAFMQALIAANRIPVVTQAVVRMQSDAIKNTLMVSNPGPGNDGKPTDPGLPPVKPLPDCPPANPTCRGSDAPPSEPPSCP
jgi:hypothetical protein